MPAWLSKGTKKVVNKFQSKKGMINIAMQSLLKPAVGIKVKSSFKEKSITQSQISIYFITSVA